MTTNDPTVAAKQNDQSQPIWMQDEWEEFDRLLQLLDVHADDEIPRANARVAVCKFVNRVGREKCDAMYEAGAGQRSDLPKKPR